MPELTGGTERVDLGRQFTIVAPGLRGQAELRLPGTPELRAAEQTTPGLDDALVRANMTTLATVDIKPLQVPIAAESPRGALRDPRGDAALLLEVPDLGEKVGQVVMLVDEAGAISWHFPLEGTAIQAPANRGAAAKKRFLIRTAAPPPPKAGTSANRSIIGAVGRKLLKIIVYPITDALIGKPAAAIAEHWEMDHRAYGLRDFLPESFNTPTGRPLASDDIASLGKGNALLFIHGTFSTAHGAFADMPPALVTELHKRYGGRLFAFNHFTLSHDPARNVRWFADELRRLSASTRLTLDIVCHSRGGLVARTLAEGAHAFGLATDQIHTGRIVFVAVPNNGTLLVQPDYMINMIDRLTTGLNLFPPSGFLDVLDGILIAVKIIGHGALKGLEGLRSMNVQEPFLKKLNTGGSKNAGYYAVAANYEPQDPGLRALVSGSVNAVVDRVFQGVENDLVVPEHGVYEENGSGCFPIDEARILRIPATAGRTHTNLFGDADVSRQIGTWLQ